MAYPYTTLNFYDNHTLYIKCESASSEQIRQSFSEALIKYQNITKTTLDCKFKVNLVENREGISYGFAYVFVSDPAVYHMILGKNPDGSDRIEYRDDPSWIASVDEDSVNDGGWSVISGSILNFTMDINWSDMVEEEEFEHRKKRHTRPKILVVLDPLMTLPPYRLTDNQILSKRCKIAADNKYNQNFDGVPVEISEMAYLSVNRAMVSSLDPKFMHNILKCKDIPVYITKDDLKVQFSPFASDSKTFQERFIKGRRISETYPFVNISVDNVAFIIFDPRTHDAQFALHMMKKTIIRKKLDNDTMKQVTLIFGHSYRTDRDITTDLNQKPRIIKRHINDNKSQTDFTYQRGNSRKYHANDDNSSWENNGPRKYNDLRFDNRSRKTENIEYQRQEPNKITNPFNALLHMTDQK
jgi:hypothetical protein